MQVTSFRGPKGAVRSRINGDGIVNRSNNTEVVFRASTRGSHNLQPKVFGPRTWHHNLKVFDFKPNGKQTVVFLQGDGQALCLPNIVWMLLGNGVFLGIYIYQVSTTRLAPF
ncbi:hypothetical protein CDEST_08663 [Colletotrichum destructivum]|uniref:Uncharacterized protein n=1 Tax=Colletotrichum destructivum TaxID=34406 RepID=A0AAX4ILA0_9PEZI|nr:hypothetical protein CDEST_08663 [Colletotrichum destructivum]